MKKILVSLFSLAVIIFSSLMFTACSDTQTVTLTAENWEDYIAVNLYYTDLVYDKDETTGIYHMACVGHLETSAKKEKTIFNGVDLRIKPVAIDISWEAITTDVLGFFLDIDYSGYSHSSFSAYSTQEEYDYLYLGYPSNYGIIFDTISIKGSISIL